MIDCYGNEIGWTPEIKKDGKPLYISIAESIEKDIEEGKLVSGFRLPPQRIIANYLGINHSTVTRAYKLCEEKGLITGTIGKGTFVSRTAGIPSGLLTDHEENSVIEMGMVLPLYEVNRLTESHVKELYDSIDYDLALKYTPPQGHVRHRYIAAKWLKQYKIDTTADNILITSGTQNALSVILVSLFNKGDRIVVDELSYPGLKGLAELLGIILVPVKWGSRGMDTDELRTVCKREKVKGIYLIPDCHNPTSITMDMNTRKEISEITAKYNLLLIEDGTFSFCMEKRLKPISAINPENSIYIHGTSKALNPTFRISYIVAPDRHVKKLQHGINNLTWMASPFTAELVSLLQTSSAYDEIVSRKVNILKERNRIADETLKGMNLIPAKVSMFRYLLLPEGLGNAYDSVAGCKGGTASVEAAGCNGRTAPVGAAGDAFDALVEEACLREGVQIFSSQRFVTGIGSNNNGIRISVSGPADNDDLIRGLNVIRNVVMKG